MPSPVSLDAIQNEIYSLTAETLAMQSLLVSLCSRLSAADPKLRLLIAQAFDDAARFVEDRAIVIGKAASPKHTVQAIKIVEQLRAAALGNQEKPKHGV